MEMFAAVVAAFEGDAEVVFGEGKGFGSRALKVKGKIFALCSSKGEFVVKLPAARVAELVGSGAGSPFEPRHGRPMKEWLVVHDDAARWGEYARAARAFVGGR